MAKQWRLLLLVAICFEAAWGAAIGGICKSIVQKHGYQCQEYTVTTNDGYILSLQRIPHGRSNQSKITGKKQPVLLQHGIMVGTLTALASLAQGKLLNLLKSAALLCPIAYMSHMTSLSRSIAMPSPGQSNYWMALPEFNPKGKAVAMLVNSICKIRRINCYDLISVFTGKNCCLNSSTIKFFLKHGPQSTATKNIVHLNQMIRSGTIAMYDYENFFQNIQHYGRIQPPKYDMLSIPEDFPLFISYGGKDIVSDPQDVRILLDDLMYHKLTTKFIHNYAHMDFIMATNAKHTLYNLIIGFFHAHSHP